MEESMAWYLLAWQRATDFSGRSRRTEYWMFQLFNFLAGLLLGLAAFATGALFGEQDGYRTFAICLGVFGFVSFIPALSVTVRRLHDIGKSGWWYFIAFVPLIGGLILFVFTLLDSDPDRNEYGPNPKVPGHANVII
jgi:uncharacterized membrane protein YhaH (DUF805 family)